MRPIYVIDTETTGLQGIQQGDKIVEVGIARVDLELEKVYPEFDRIINIRLNERDVHAWVFDHTDLGVEDVMCSPWTVSEVGRALIYYEREVFTSYNIDFDFDRFLHQPPWSFYPKLAPCIMEEASARYGEDGRWFSAQMAYDLLCPDNPADLPEGKEQHRALSDAVVEGHILLRLLENNDDIRTKYFDVLEEAP